MRATHHKNDPASCGFSVVELMVSLGITMVLMAGGIKAVNYCQRIYQRSQLTADMDDEIRSAMDLAEQELGQAGSLNSPARTFTAAITANASAQAAAISSTTDLFVGEKILVDTGASQEVVAITIVNTTSGTVSGVFTHNHSASTPVALLGVFPQGVLSSSTGSRLKFYGDVNGDGTLVYVEYVCDYTEQTLRRSVTPINVTSRAAGTILIRNLVANDNGSACFTYPASPPTGAGFTFINQLGMTLTVQSATQDPLKKDYLKATRSNLNINPRNIQFGLTMASDGQPDRLQPTPPNVTTNLAP